MICKLLKNGTKANNMEKIEIIITILDKIKKLNIKNPSVVASNSRNENIFMSHKLLFNSMTIVESDINMLLSHIEDIITDIYVTNTRGFQLIYFCDNIMKWLITGEKSALKEILMKNIESDYDIEYINNWYE